MAPTCGREGLLAVLVGVTLAWSCTPPLPRPPTPSRSRTTTIQELHEAIARWHRTRATITYRTERQRPGFPASAHQCLRQVVGDRSEIPMGLTMCDPAGVVTLAWDPPTRWRLDVTEAGATTSAVVIGSRGVVCERTDGPDATCRSQPVNEIARAFPFHELIAGVRPTVQEVGITPGGSITVTEGVVAHTQVRCFERGSAQSGVTWCFAGDVLLSLTLRLEGRAPTIAEAERFSGDVADERFEPPTT